MTTGKGERSMMPGQGRHAAPSVRTYSIIIETSGLLFLRFQGQKANVVWHRGFLCTLDCAANQRCASG